MDDVRLLEVLDDAVAAVRAALDALEDWGPAGTRPGQYRLDLAADAAALPVLHGAGLAVLSEESGVTGGASSGLLAVIDPVDGSTNAHRGVPFYATSICVLDAEGPRVGVVVNQATGVRFAAVRGGGADRDGETIAPSGCTHLGSAIVGISGFPGHHPGWAQYRALGAASLECCAVAEGVLDAYLVVGHEHAVRMGLPGRACSSAARPAPPRVSATAGTSRCVTRRAAGPSWRRRRRWRSA